MKKVSNNLDPQAQRWVRNVEDSISNLEKLTAGLAESDRQNAVVVGSITQAVAAIRAQQERILEGTTSIVFSDVYASGVYSDPDIEYFGSIDVPRPSWATSATVVALGTLFAAYGGPARDHVATLTLTTLGGYESPTNTVDFKDSVTLTNFYTPGNTDSVLTVTVEVSVIAADYDGGSTIPSAYVQGSIPVLIFWS